MDGDFPDIPVPDMADERPSPCRRWDLDRNNHVNNAVYFSGLPRRFPKKQPTCSLVRVDGEYLRPTEGRGDIRVRTSRQEDRTVSPVSFTPSSVRRGTKRPVSLHVGNGNNCF